MSADIFGSLCFHFALHVAVMIVIEGKGSPQKIVWSSEKFSPSPNSLNHIAPLASDFLPPFLVSTQLRVLLSWFSSSSSKNVGQFLQQLMTPNSQLPPSKMAPWPLLGCCSLLMCWRCPYCIVYKVTYKKSADRRDKWRSGDINQVRIVKKSADRWDKCDINQLRIVSWDFQLQQLVSIHCVTPLARRGEGRLLINIDSDTKLIYK